jgi:hypothetical protein
LRTATALFLAAASASVHGQAATAPAACGEAGRAAARSTTVLAFQLENDLFVGTDSQYTNGAKLTWVSPNLCTFDDESLPDWLRRSNGVFKDVVGRLHSERASALNMVVTLGQAMYTPADRDRIDVDPADRPYAGWTYLGLGYNARYDPAGTAPGLESVEIDLGIVGPHSYAKQTQDAVHRMRGFKRFAGWDHQLHDEPGLQIVWERKVRLPGFAWRHDLGAELIPHYGASAGNIASYLNVGGEIRLGWRLPDDFGTSAIRPGGDNAAPRGALPANTPAQRLYRQHSFHLFASFDGRAVANNIFLDGNTFRHSHAVKKRLLVGDIAYGWAWTWPAWNGLPSGKLAYSHYVQSREFEGEARNHGFGSVSVSLEF